MWKRKPICKSCEGSGTYVTDGGGRASCENCNGSGVYDEQERMKQDYNDAWRQGYKAAFDEAYDIIIKAATAYFVEGNDDNAQLLRSYAVEIANKAKEHLHGK